MDETLGTLTSDESDTLDKLMEYSQVKASNVETCTHKWTSTQSKPSEEITTQQNETFKKNTSILDLTSTPAISNVADNMSLSQNIIQLELDFSDSDTILATDAVSMSQIDTTGVWDKDADIIISQDQAPDHSSDSTAVKEKDTTETVGGIGEIMKSNQTMDLTVVKERDIIESVIDTVETVLMKDTTGNSDKTMKQDHAHSKNQDATVLKGQEEINKIKKVKVLLHRLSKEEIDEATEIKNSEIISKLPCPSS